MSENSFKYIFAVGLHWLCSYSFLPSYPMRQEAWEADMRRNRSFNLLVWPMLGYCQLRSILVPFLWIEDSLQTARALTFGRFLWNLSLHVMFLDLEYWVVPRPIIPLYFFIIMTDLGICPEFWCVISTNHWSSEHLRFLRPQQIGAEKRGSMYLASFILTTRFTVIHTNMGKWVFLCRNRNKFRIVETMKLW